VFLAVLAPLVNTTGFQGRFGRHALGIGALVAHQQFRGDPLQIGTFDAGGGPGEVLVDHGVMQADRLENLGAAITLHGGDTHLGHGLDHTLDGGLDEVLDRLLVVDARQHAQLDHVVHGFEGQVRIDGVDAIAQQYGKVVHFTGFTRLQHQGNPGTGLAADQVVMQP